MWVQLGKGARHKGTARSVLGHDLEASLSLTLEASLVGTALEPFTPEGLRAVGVHAVRALGATLLAVRLK